MNQIRGKTILGHMGIARSLPLTKSWQPIAFSDETPFVLPECGWRWSRYFYVRAEVTVAKKINSAVLLRQQTPIREHSWAWYYQRNYCKSLPQGFKLSFVEGSPWEMSELYSLLALPLSQPWKDLPYQTKISIAVYNNAWFHVNATHTVQLAYLDVLAKNVAHVYRCFSKTKPLQPVGNYPPTFLQCYWAEGSGGSKECHVGT